MGDGAEFEKSMAERGLVRADKSNLSEAFGAPSANGSMSLRSTSYSSEKSDETYDWEIDVSKVMCTNELASGAFGKVFHGLYNNDDVAVKLMNVPPNISRAELDGLKTSFKQEIQVWSTLKHENIVQFLGASLHARNIKAPPDAKPPPGQPFWAIITEYMSGGTLKGYLVRKGKLKLRDIIKLALDIARGLEYLHSKDIVHRDMKSDNLLMDHTNTVKIADFGVARTEAKNPVDMTCETGTVRWMAPEVISHKPYTHKIDVYSFGIVLWELVTSELPFKSLSFAQLAFNVVNKKVRPDIPDDCHPQLASLMKACWDDNPDVRPEFSAIVKTLEDLQNDNGGPAKRGDGGGCCAIQ